MTGNSVLASLESLWHYGLPTTSPLQISSSIATTPPPPNLTHTSSCSASSPAANESTVLSSQVGSSLQSLFSVMDEDNDGRLSFCDLHSLLSKLGISSQSTDLQPFIEHTSDGNISLDFPQFAQLYASLFGASHDCSTPGPAAECNNDDCFDDELLDAFCVYDTNHDGFISAAELAAVLLELGLLPDHGSGIDAHLGRCQAYIESVDLDGNGMVDLVEFKSMMTQNHLSALPSRNVITTNSSFPLTRRHG